MKTLSKDINKSESSLCRLLVVAALPCEARLFIDSYRLKIIKRAPWQVFYNNELHIALVVTGVGKINCSAATSYASSFLNLPSYASLVNIGIAGAKEISIGEVVVANKIIDNSTNKNLFPFKVFPNARHENVTSYENIVFDYPENSCVDMEAFSFFTVASKFVSVEHVQVVKLISDNKNSQIPSINTSFVLEVIKSKKDVLLTFLDKLIDLANNEAIIAYKRDLKSIDIEGKFKLSSYQKNYLNNLMKDYITREGKASLSEIVESSIDINSFVAKLNESYKKPKFLSE